MSRRHIPTAAIFLALLILAIGAAWCRCEEPSRSSRDGGGAAAEDATTGGDGTAQHDAADDGGGGEAAGARDAAATGDGDVDGTAPAADDAGPAADQDAGAATEDAHDGGATTAADAATPERADAGATDAGAPTAEASDAAAEEADPEARRVAGLVQARYREALGFEADFEQTYRNRLMGRNQKSSGHVWLRPPDRMRWEYAPPSKNLIVADGRHLFVFEPEPNQVARMPVSGSELPSVMAFLTGGRNLEEDYRVRSVHQEQLEPRGQAGLELRPRRPSSVISRVVLVVSRAAGEVLRTVLVDPEGNTNTFVWDEVRTDRDLPDARFRFTPPAGARIVER